MSKDSYTQKSSNVKVDSVANPTDGRDEELEGGQICNNDFHVLATQHGWTMGTYTNKDGSSGYILTNGQSIFHFDSAGNIILASGKTGQSGCGGKVIIRADDRMESSRSVSIHVKGNDDERTKTNNGGKEEVEKTPAYSLFVEGDVAIESKGGEIVLGGSNITINAANVLTLKAGEMINLEAGEGGGKINVLTNDYNLNTTFLSETINGGKYTDGAGEVTVNQKQNPSAMTSINTVGGINYMVNGDYRIAVKKDFQLSSDGNVLFSGRAGYASKFKGNFYEEITGKKLEKIYGRSQSQDQKETYVLDVGPGQEESIKIKSSSSISIDSVSGDIKANARRNIDIKATGKVQIQGMQIYLNA
jgi:hypothetical protein